MSFVLTRFDAAIVCLTIQNVEKFLAGTPQNVVSG